MATKHSTCHLHADAEGKDLRLGKEDICKQILLAPPPSFSPPPPEKKSLFVLTIIITAMMVIDTEIIIPSVLHTMLCCRPHYTGQATEAQCIQGIWE